MKRIKNLFLFNKQKIENKKNYNQEVSDQYNEIGKLIKDARVKQNLTIEELSLVSRIPEQTINSIENNNKNTMPKYPFIRSILIKLEECLVLKKNTLVKLAITETEILKKGKKKLIVRKLDLLNTWQGSLLYFLILVSTIFLLKRYFSLNVNIIEIQNFENIMNNK